MPLGPEYDKQIDSQFADMKNTGTRNGGSITPPSSCSVSSTARRGRISTSRNRDGRAENRHQSELGSGYGVRAVWSAWSRSI